MNDPEVLGLGLGIGFAVGYAVKAGVDRVTAKVRNALHEEVDGILKARDNNQ